MELLKVSENEKKKVREFYETDEARIKQDLEIIKEWYKKRPHLPQGLNNDGLIERVLLGSKFRTEKTKDKLDNYYTVKTVYKELFVGLDKLVPSKLDALYLPLPKLTADQERIILVRLAHPESNELNFEEFTKMTFAITEFFLKYDYAKGLRVVADFKGVRLEHITKINASLMQKIVSATQDALANRVLGIDLFSTPSYVNILLGILKRVMKPKLFERIRIHDNLESLTIPKDLLPEDLGGTLEHTSKLLEKWDAEFETHSKFLKEEVTLCSDESKRQEKSKYNVVDSFGVEGSFRKLNLD
ncbi:uncharacterized protein LOC109604253 [Aethina tumida]|uniref:uncharacterized protein LOC109604253 n=1 Tax=Aethina tumida TaxID=116153 RepID=UPI0021490C3D|nr:uncharacterized protein LOC109604253 [Aethina tumida]